MRFEPDMRLSNLADYAIVLMSAAARHCGQQALDASGNLKPARVSAGALAAETGVPVATAHKLVHHLVRAGLLRSVRGAGGGVKLTRPAAAITLADIIEAVEGPIALTSCVDVAKADCALDHHCSVKPHWAVVNSAVRGALADVPLTRLVRAA
jgi:Rrf2 family protein